MAISVTAIHYIDFPPSTAGNDEATISGAWVNPDFALYFFTAFAAN